MFIISILYARLESCLKSLKYIYLYLLICLLFLKGLNAPHHLYHCQTFHCSIVKQIVFSPMKNKFTENQITILNLRFPNTKRFHHIQQCDSSSSHCPLVRMLFSFCFMKSPVLLLLLKIILVKLHCIKDFLLNKYLSGCSYHITESV